MKEAVSGVLESYVWIKLGTDNWARRHELTAHRMNIIDSIENYM
jgi:hypothetical protein